MKKKRLMSLLLILIPLLTSAQDLKGAWKGLLEVGPAKLNIVFHIHDDNNVTMDSPDQGAMELPTKVVCMQEDSISVTMPRLGAQYAG